MKISPKPLDGVQSLTSFYQQLSRDGNLRERFLAGFALAPVPDERLQSVRRDLHEELRCELQQKKLPEDEVVQRLARALELRELLREATALYRRRPRHIYAAARVRVLGHFKRRLALPNLSAEERIATKFLVLLAEINDISPLRKLDTAAWAVFADLCRSVRPDTFALKCGAVWLTELVRRHASTPHRGLVAALLHSAGLMEQVECWVSAPTSGPQGQRRHWCPRPGRQCSKKPLRCAKASLRVREALRT